MAACRIFEFNDPHPYQAAVRAANVELLATERGAFCFQLLQIDLNRLWMQRGSESLPGVSHSAAPDGRAAIEFLTGADQPAYRHNGVEVRPGEMVVNDLRLAHRRWSTPHRWGAMSLSPTGLAQVGYALVGRDLTVPPVARCSTGARAHEEPLDASCGDRPARQGSSRRARACGGRSVARAGADTGDDRVVVPRHFRRAALHRSSAHRNHGTARGFLGSAP